MMACNHQVDLQYEVYCLIFNYFKCQMCPYGWFSKIQSHTRIRCYTHRGECNSLPIRLENIMLLRKITYFSYLKFFFIHLFFSVKYWERTIKIWWKYTTKQKQCLNPWANMWPHFCIIVAGQMWARQGKE